MITTTEILGLSLPDRKEPFSVDLYNENFKKIDDALKNFDEITNSSSKQNNE